MQLWLKGTFGSGRLFSSSSGHSCCSAYIFEMVGPYLVKLVPLETRLLELSDGTNFIQFGPVPKKLWPREDSSTVGYCVCNLNALNVSVSSTTKLLMHEFQLIQRCMHLFGIFEGLYIKERKFERLGFLKMHSSSYFIFLSSNFPRVRMRCTHLCNLNSKGLGSFIKSIPNLVYWHCIRESSFELK